jgi:hypothetical protein
MGQGTPEPGDPRGAQQGSFFDPAMPQRTTSTPPQAPPGTFGADPAASIGGVMPAQQPGFAAPGTQLQGPPGVPDLLAAAMYEQQNPMDHAARTPVSSDPSEQDPLLAQIREYAQATAMEIMRNKSAPPTRGYSMAEAWAIARDPRLAGAIMARKRNDWHQQISQQEMRLKGVQTLLGIGKNLQAMDQQPDPFMHNVSPGGTVLGAPGPGGEANIHYQAPYSPSQMGTEKGRSGGMSDFQFMNQGVMPPDMVEGTPEYEAQFQAMTSLQEKKQELLERGLRKEQVERFTALAEAWYGNPLNLNKSPTKEQYEEWAEIASLESSISQAMPTAGPYVEAPDRNELLGMTLPEGLAVPGNADEQYYQLEKILEKRYGAEAAAKVPEGIKQQMIRTFYGNE